MLQQTSNISQCNTTWFAFLHVCAAYLHLLHYTYHAIPNEEWWTMSLLLAVWCALAPSVVESWKSE